MSYNFCFAWKWSFILSNDPIIKNRADYLSYPWNDIPRLFFEKYEDDFKLLESEMPTGMKAIGGPGNGIFECIQDIVGLSNLCLINKYIDIGYRC